ncbi:MAG: hypothetical protein QXP36_12680, partial [Conexivisphaerales archaeon]
FSIYNNKKLTKFFKISTSFDHARFIFATYAQNGFIFAVEDQYLSLNPKTLVKLVEVRSMLVTMASFYNASKILIIPPQKWQTEYLGVSLNEKRTQRKEVSCFIASQLAQTPIDDIDIADAICIGDYAVKLQSAYAIAYEETKKIKKRGIKNG